MCVRVIEGELQKRQNNISGTKIRRRRGIITLKPQPAAFTTYARRDVLNTPTRFSSTYSLFVVTLLFFFFIFKSPSVFRYYIIYQLPFLYEEREIEIQIEVGTEKKRQNNNILKKTKKEARKKQKVRRSKLQSKNWTEIKRLRQSERIEGIKKGRKTKEKGTG